MFFSILFQSAYYFTRNSRRDNIAWKIPINHTPCSDNNIISYMNIG